jgi:dGTPase
MYATLYHSPSQLAVADTAKGLLSRLFAAYAAEPALLPAEWRAALPADDPARTRHIADFIAGMTDRYAIARHCEVVGPVEMPEGF